MIKVSVLLLNATYEPLRVISLQRAVVLLIQGKAQLIEQKDGTLRSVSTEIPVPAVVRLTNFVKIPWAGEVPFSKRGVLARDNHECQFSHCDRRANTIDHVMPRALGGADRDWTNAVAACYRCNQKKADNTLKQMNWKLKREPRAPKGALVLHAVRAKNSIDPAWEPYLAYLA